VVQARPITAVAARPADPAGGQVAGEQWNESLAGEYLWTNGNLGEALPDVMTPATWSFIELLMGQATRSEVIRSVWVARTWPALSGGRCRYPRVAMPRTKISA
jgi:hypothetical protein